MGAAVPKKPSEQYQKMAEDQFTLAKDSAESGDQSVGHGNDLLGAGDGTGALEWYKDAAWWYGQAAKSTARGIEDQLDAWLLDALGF